MTHAKGMRSLHVVRPLEPAQHKHNNHPAGRPCNKVRGRQTRSKLSVVSVALGLRTPDGGPIPIRKVCDRSQERPISGRT